MITLIGSLFLAMADTPFLAMFIYVYERMAYIFLPQTVFRLTCSAPVFLFFGWLMGQNFAFVLLRYVGERFRELLL